MAIRASSGPALGAQCAFATLTAGVVGAGVGCLVRAAAGPRSGPSGLDRQSAAGPRARLFEQLGATSRPRQTTDLRPLAACDLIVTATTAGRPLRHRTALGTIICDVARSRHAAQRARADLSDRRRSRSASRSCNPLRRGQPSNARRRNAPLLARLFCSRWRRLAITESATSRWPRLTGAGPAARLQLTLAGSARYRLRRASLPLGPIASRVNQKWAFQIFSKWRRWLSISISRWVGAVPARRGRARAEGAERAGRRAAAGNPRSPPLAQGIVVWPCSWSSRRRRCASRAL
jgi:hypothetical protein